MAAFPARPYDEFMAHWAKIMADEATLIRTILFHGKVAGNVVYWEQSGERNVGYWLGREYWSKGIASAALTQFLDQANGRPLYAHAAKRNAASIRVLQKCGFTVSGEGVFPGIDGESDTELVMVLGADSSAEKA